MKSLKIEAILGWITVFAGFVFSLFNIFQYAGEPTLGADIVSRVLPAIGHRISLGIPYVDYWEITPPGHYIILDVWAQFFGFSALSVKALHVTVSFGIIFLTYYILSKFLKGLYLSVTSGVIYFFLFSVRFTTFILPAEILGLFFSLCGMASLLYFKNPKRALFIAAFLFFFSGQIKDPYLFSVLALIPFIFFQLLKSRKDFFIAIWYSFTGVLTAAILNISYLLVLRSWDQYVEILKYKSAAFEVFDLEWLFNNFFIHLEFARDVFFHLPYTILTPIFLYLTAKLLSKIWDKTLIIKIISKSKSKILSGNFNWRIEKIDLWVLAFYIIGLSIGFVIQRSLGSHYYIVAVFPITGLIGLCFYNIDREIARSKKSKLAKLITFLIFLSFVIPKKDYFLKYEFGRLPDLRFIPKLALWAHKNSISPIVKRITEKTDKNDCIIDIYGWGVGTTYLYAQRRPCSRFYITNLIAKEWQREEFRASLLKNTPKSLIYNPTAGDLDSKRFEEIVTNFPKVINNCYVKEPDFETLYFPKYKDMELKSCLEKSLF